MFCHIYLIPGGRSPRALAATCALTAILLFWASTGYSQGTQPVCEEEIRAQESAPLTADERSRLEYFKRRDRTEGGRYLEATELVRSHLDDNRNNFSSDSSAVSACLLKAVADMSRFAEAAAHAQEAYALRLLHGSGVPRNRELAIVYLERAARRGYQSAGVHLAKLYLAEANSPAGKAKAIQWLEFSSFFDESKSIGGWSAGDSFPIELLFDLHIAERNFKAAEALYRRARDHAYSKSMLAFHLKQIPGLKPRIEAEEAEAARIAELARQQRALDQGQRTQTCITYKSGYKSCR